MNKEQRDELIDDLLVFLNEEVEKKGRKPNVVRFDFVEDDQWRPEYLAITDGNADALEVAVNTCLSRGLLKHVTRRGKYLNLVLTEEGQGRALSVDAARQKPQPKIPTGDIHIRTLHASGATQIGHGNTQNIESIVQSWVDAIDKAEGTPAEKEEAKSLLLKFLEHPLTQTAIGVGSTIVIAAQGG